MFNLRKEVIVGLISFLILILLVTGVFSQGKLWRDATKFEELPSSVDLSSFNEEDSIGLENKIESLIEAKIEEDSPTGEYAYIIKEDEEKGIVRLEFFAIRGEEETTVTSGCYKINGQCDTTKGESSANCPIDCGAPKPTTSITCSITPNPTTINPGQSSTLKMTTLGQVTSATLDGTTVSNTGGTKTVSPTTTTMYSGIVINAGGSNNCRSNVFVAPPPGPNSGCYKINGQCDTTKGESSANCPIDCYSQFPTPPGMPSSGFPTGMATSNLLTGMQTADPINSLSSVCACSDQCNNLCKAVGDKNVAPCPTYNKACCKKGETCHIPDPYFGKRRPEYAACCPVGYVGKDIKTIAYCQKDDKFCQENGQLERGLEAGAGNTACGPFCCGPTEDCKGSIIDLPGRCVPKTGCPSERVCGKLCCAIGGEKCVKNNKNIFNDEGYASCQATPLSCSLPNTICAGKGEWSGLIFCCPSGTNCANHPDGTPRCLKPS